MARVTVAAVVAASSVLGAVYFVKGLRQLDDRATSSSDLSYSDREIAGGNDIVIDQEAAYEARELIPETEHYRVVIGGLLKEARPLTVPFAETWYRYFLMPRRPDPAARWVICYGCDVTGLGGRYVPQWGDANGISIGRVQ